MSEVDVVVIGAGAAGIAAGRRLTADNVSVVVVEARTRLGGRAWTHEIEGMPLDLGCGWLHSADENEWAKIAGELGFTLDKTPPPWNRHGGDLAWPHEMQREFRAAITQFYERLEAQADAPDQPAVNILEPDNPWNGLLNGMSTWINGVELPNVSVHDWNRYHDSGVNWRVTQGYGALMARYGSDLDVRFDCAATLIDHTGPRLRVETSRGTITARAAIVTVPTAAIAGERLRFTPALPGKVAAAHDLPLGLADKLFLHLESPEDFPREKRVFGATDTARTGSYHLRPFGRPVIEGYFGGALARELETEGERGFAAFAADQLAGHFGEKVRRGLRLLAASSWARDPYAFGSYSYAKPGRANARTILAQSVDERLFFAGEACSAHDFSTAHGAYRTGVAAGEQARRILARN